MVNGHITTSSVSAITMLQWRVEGLRQSVVVHEVQVQVLVHSNEESEPLATQFSKRGSLCRDGTLAPA